MSAISQTFTKFFSQQTVDLGRLAADLNGMDEPERIAAVRSINGKMQAQLWEAAIDSETTLEDLVPSHLPACTPVIHYGKNSLPVLSNFEKRFSRPSPEADVVYGYNEGFTRKFIGPGYFVAEYVEARREVGVNYYKVPPVHGPLPEGWPAVKPNEEGLQVLVFAKMVDYLRKVSDHVTIGRAYKHGRETPNYFLLCRQDLG